MKRFMLIVFVIMLGSPVLAKLDVAELAQLERQLSGTAALQGDEYIEGRESLELVCKKKPEYMEHLARSSTNWPVRMVASIVVERSNKESAIQHFMDWKPKLEYRRSATDRIRIAGEAIEKKALNVPFFLIEAFWKSNELDSAPLQSKFYRSDPQWAYLANAIGKLKLKAARPVLEEALSDDFYIGKESDLYAPVWRTTIRVEVAKALGKIGSSESVPALLARIEMDPNGNERSTLYIMGALLACVDQGCEEYLRQQMQKSTNDDFSKHIKTLLQKIRDKE